MTFTARKSTHLCYVPLDQVKDLWGTAWEFLRVAVERPGEMNDEDILAQIAQCKMHLFMVNCEGNWIGALTVRIARERKQTAAIVVHLGGDFDDMAVLLPELKHWALAYGASVLRFYGRKGWRKRAAPLGFKEKFVVMEAPING